MKWFGWVPSTLRLLVIDRAIGEIVKYLFVHQNFPGQYKNLVAHLRNDPQNEVVFLTERQDRAMANVRKIVYKTTRAVSRSTHQYLRQIEHAVLRGQAVARVALKLKSAGFVPDIMMGHNAWGEILYLKDVFPDVPLLGYFEFFRKPWGGCLDFDPEYPPDYDSRAKLRTLGSVDLLGLNATDWGQTATQWQRSQHPARYRDMISVVHEGIDTDLIKPDRDANLEVDGITLSHHDEVITYTARNLEPYRGFHTFMRALPAILKRRPQAHIVIVGGDEVSYGRLPPKGETYRGMMLKEVGKGLPAARALHGLDSIRRIPESAAGLVRARIPHVSLCAVVVDAGSDGGGVPRHRLGNCTREGSDSRLQERAAGRFLFAATNCRKNR